MLDSKAVAAIQQDEDKVWRLYIRADYREELNMWSFFQYLKAFTSEREAHVFFVKNWPQGKIVDFTSLTLAI
jgi:hypothetical protein